MKNLLLFLFLLTIHLAQAQKLKKTDKVIIDNLKSHIGYLASDELEGRRTGTKGEQLAFEYISKQFATIGLEPKGDNGFIQAFEVNEGKMISGNTHLFINGKELSLTTDYFPLIYSASNTVKASASMALRESGIPWFVDVKELLEENKNNPHFDLNDAIQSLAKDFASKGATALIVFNTSSMDDGLGFKAKETTAPLSIPIIYIQKETAKKFLHDDSAMLEINISVDIVKKVRTGHNVIGYINNNAERTVILGAHYDHLGFGEDKNSLYAGTTPLIHNGADDNASGTAALIELARILKKSKYKNNNYLFVSFSGEELGLFGSKYFTEHPTISITNANYMINLDMVGRLNDSNKITIGGYGTSPYWGNYFKNLKDKKFTIHFDSSGRGPSDHTSFYLKDIPVLFFFTGTHSDYHKPSDDADKINYIGEYRIMQLIKKLIDDTDDENKLAFTKTRDPQMARSSFSVSLGIMPDYTYAGGVKVDGVSEGRAAQKAGIKTGDIILQLGDFKFSDVSSYMQALSKFKKGDSTKVKVKRGSEELVFDITF